MPTSAQAGIAQFPTGKKELANGCGLAYHLNVSPFGNFPSGVGKIIAVPQAFK